MAESELSAPPRPSGISNWGGARAGAGRPLGSRGRRPDDILKQVEINGKTPLTVLRDICYDDTVDLTLRERAGWHLAQFCYPRKAAVEVTAEVDDRRPHEIEGGLLEMMVELAVKNPGFRDMFARAVGVNAIEGEIVERRDLIGDDE